MSADSFAKFVSDLRQSGLLSSAQSSELDALRKSFPNVQDLAAELRRRGWLTQFQIEELRSGGVEKLMVGPYRLVERIGAGGLGEVYKAYRPELDRIVALKVIRADLTNSPEVLHRFQREIRLSGQLDHENLVLIFDCGEDKGRPYLVMQYLDGQTLNEYVRKGEPLSVTQACHYLRQMAEGLKHIHDNHLIHRDLKPANMILANETTIKILDLGIARLHHTLNTGEADTITHQGAIVGTPVYMAPEQFETPHLVDVRADLFSLGCILYFMLTAKVPFHFGSLTERIASLQSPPDPPLQQLRPDAPVWVVQLLDKLLAYKPEDRFQTPEQLLRALDREIENPTPRTEPSSIGTEDVHDYPTQVNAAPDHPSTEIPKPKAGSYSLLWSLFAGLLLLVGASLTVWYWQPWKDSTTQPIPIEHGGQLTVTKKNASIPALKPGEFFEFKGVKGPIRSLRISEDGKRLLTVGESDIHQVWDLKTGTVLKELQQKVLDMAMSPDGRTVFLICPEANNRQIIRWQVDTNEFSDGPKLTNRPQALAFHPDGRSILVGGETEPFYFVSVQHLDVIRTIPPDNIHREFSTTGIQFLQAGNRFLTTSEKRIFLWDLALNGYLRGCFDAGLKEVRVNAATANDQWLVFSLKGMTRMGIYDLIKGSIARDTLIGHTEKITCVTFTPDGKRILSGSRDTTLRLWDTDTAKELHTFTGHPDSITDVVVLPGNHQAIAADGSGGLRLWELPPLPSPPEPKILP